MSRLVTGAGGRPSSWYPHLAATQSPALYKTGRGSLPVSCLSPLQATFRNVIPGGAHTSTDPQTNMHAHTRLNVSFEQVYYDKKRFHLLHQSLI